MIKRLKSNNLLSTFLIIMCVVFMFNPAIYANACLNAISVWTFKVLPLLLPFFIFTRLIVNLNHVRPNYMEKFFNKAYHTPYGSFNTFFLSVLSGYPMGAKLICAMYENGQATKKQSEKMLSLCSVSGPMFILGTVGVMMLNNYKAGIIILISNIIACLLNGLIYRGKNDYTLPKPPTLCAKKENILAESVYDSLISILIVCVYIVLSFIMIEFLEQLRVLDFISNAICWVFRCGKHQNVVKSTLCGIIEITNGLQNLSSQSISINLKTILASSLIGFGGISVFLQSFNFLSKLNISPKKMLLQKTTQCLLCLIVSTFLCLLFL